jgi:putative hydroxymethylpyrimidine transport system substrate-binding protein
MMVDLDKRGRAGAGTSGGDAHARRPRARRRRLGLLALLLVAIAAVAAGCGEKSEDGQGSSEDFDLALDFFINPDHVGIFQALDAGYFADAGLNVTPRVPSDPSAPIKQVAAGQADLAISYEPEVMLAREQGLDVVAVGAIVQQPLTSMIWLGDSRISSVADLAGKTIATAGIPYQAAFLEKILRDAGLTTDDVTQVDVGLNLLPVILSGRADALLGAFLNVEGVELERRNKDPRIMPVDELGIPTYDELVLVASGERLRDDPEAIRLFIAALERGTQDAAADPGAATDILLAASEDLDPGLTRAEVARTLPLLLPAAGQQYGFMDPDQWNAFAGFMADEGLTERRLDSGELLTNELLPGEIPG